MPRLQPAMPHHNDYRSFSLYFFFSLLSSFYFFLQYDLVREIVDGSNQVNKWGESIIVAWAIPHLLLGQHGKKIMHQLRHITLIIGSNLTTSVIDCQKKQLPQGRWILCFRQSNKTTKKNVWICYKQSGSSNKNRNRRDEKIQKKNECPPEPIDSQQTEVKVMKSPKVIFFKSHDSYRWCDHHRFVFLYTDYLTSQT